MGCLRPLNEVLTRHGYLQHETLMFMVRHGFINKWHTIFGKTNFEGLRAWVEHVPFLQWFFLEEIADFVA